jgi:uroporphyrin-III C-methyltransferase
MNDINSSPHTHRVTVFVAVTGLLLAGYAVWRADKVRDREDTTRDRVQILETANSTLRAELVASAERESRARAELQKQWQQLASLPQQVKDLAAAHEDLQARADRPQRAWSRAEAIFLIELAQRRLYFDHDTPTAISALETADARLASLRDTSLTPVRERLAKDLQALRAVAEPDRAGITTRLLAIESQANTLPLKGTLVGQRTAASQPNPEAPLTHRAWDAVRNMFGQLFSVRHLRPGNTIVSIEEQTLRRQHLALLGFAARHAVLVHDQAAYTAAIDEMHAWLAQHFGESLAVDAASHELETLKSINIAPSLPNVGGAAQLLARLSATSP